MCLVGAAVAKPALEIRLAPPKNLYPEVTAAIAALDAKREAAQARELAALDAAGSRSFLQRTADDVVVKVAPGAAIPHSVIRKIEALEASRSAAESRMVDDALARLRGASFLAEQKTGQDVQVVVGASDIPWPRVATLVDEMESRRDDGLHKLRLKIMEKLR